MRTAIGTHENIIWCARRNLATHRTLNGPCPFLERMFDDQLVEYPSLQLVSVFPTRAEVSRLVIGAHHTRIVRLYYEER